MASTSTYLIYLYARSTAERPEAHAVLTVSVGPFILYFTFKTPVGILVIKWRRLNLFMFWKWEADDSETNYDILVVFDPTTPRHTPTLYLYRINIIIDTVVIIQKNQIKNLFQHLIDVRGCIQVSCIWSFYILYIMSYNHKCIILCRIINRSNLNFK